jgi:hypothetical protein
MTEAPDAGAAPSYEALERENADLKAELAKAQAKGFWDVANWQDGVKLASLPLALALGLYTAYDDVYLRFLGRDAATLGRVEESLEKIQGLNARAYQLRAAGDDAEAAAFEAANLGLRQRLADAAFEHWRAHPDFFQSSELNTLANELLMQQRTQDAMAIAATLDDSMRSTRSKAEHALFKARIPAAEGDAFDLEAAREHIREAATHASDIPTASARHATLEQIVYYRVYMELLYEQDCGYVAPFVAALEEMIIDPGGPAGAFDEEAEMLVATFENRCGA